jgi:hypothetical protein
MSRAAFRQADVARIIRAAEQEGALIEVDIRTLNFRIIPGGNKAFAIDKDAKPQADLHPDNFVRGVKENWDED